ncbi:DUF4214 domain-containing protein [Stutzerimonas balearica]|uniref:DUF4214 domain-containing protein n=1 Tax=Stutzerimonas balearica TaxID=74829 RepID=UPI0028A94E52|nr:DUF4214 domain-containing protein [Stutzerimonas balearica]
MAVTTAQVQELYVAYLGRAADQEGLNYWMAELNAEPAVMTLENLRANFVNEQQEYADIYGGLSREETIIQIYNNLFGRAPDSEGLTYWSTGDGAAVNADQLLVAFINGAAPADAQVVANKVLVSNIYTQVAGSNFSLADAAAAIAGVDATSASVSKAIGDLTSLPSVAVPEAVALVQAAAEAAKQVADFEKSQTNIDKLVALNEKVDALNQEAELGATVSPLDGADSGTDISFAEALGAQQNAQNVRDAVMLEGESATRSTAIFTTIASEAASDLADARTALVNGVTGALAAVRDFESAAAKAASLEEVDSAAVELRTAQLQAVADTQGTQWDAAVAKLSTTNMNDIDIGGGSADGEVSADELYVFLSDKDTTSAEVTAVTSAFSSLEGFSAVAELAAQAQANAKAEAALLQAQNKVAALIDGTDADALDTAYLNKFAANADAQETLANAKAADALLNDIKAVVASYNSLEKAADDAAAKLFEADAAVAVDGDTAGTGGADVFFFGSKADAESTSVDQVAGNDDVTLTVSEGDSIYIGAGWTLNSSATFKDGVITGGNNGVKEIFFVQDDNGVHALIETADYGSAAAVATTGVEGNAQVAVITLTGVESLDDVSFANGMISIA